MTAALELVNLGVAYGDNWVIRDISFALERGELACLLGPSGCGKTSLLRAIAGFEVPAAGAVRVNGQTVATPHRQTPAEKRRVGMVFQDYALFPHLSVAENVAFGLGPRKSREAMRRLDELIELVGLGPIRNYLPHMLSGGQQQRVALARSMAPRPDVLLLDEPFSSLDVEMRESIATEVRAILKQDGITSVMVSHNQLEAFAMADWIGVINEGRLQQWDTAYNLYHRPAGRYVAAFIGEGVLLPGTVRAPDAVDTELGRIEGRLPPDLETGSPVEVLIRPDDLLHDDASPMQARVMHRVFRGAEFLYTLSLPSGARVLCLVASHHDHAIGDMIGIRLAVDHLVVFPKGSGTEAAVNRPAGATAA